VGANKLVIDDAWIRYSEAPLIWTGGVGEPIPWPGCIDTVGRATAPWSGQYLSAIPNEYIMDKEPIAREVNVKPHVQRQMSFANDPELRLGYVLLGGPAELTGDDSTKCISTLSDVQLTINYTVLR
jgi:hypothetical protein